MTTGSATTLQTDSAGYLAAHPGAAVIVADPAGIVRQWNRGAESLFGWTAEEAIGRDLVDLVVSTDGPVRPEKIMEQLGQGEPWEGEFDIVRKDGTTVPTYVADTPIMGEDGRLVAIIAVSVSLTDRRTAVAAADRMARLQAVTAALSEALTPGQVVDVVMREGIAALSAEAGSVVLLTEDGSELEVVASTGYPEDLVDQWRRFPSDRDVPMAQAIRARGPIVVEGPEELLARYPAVETGPVEYQAFATVPLLIEDRALGAMWLSFTEARRFSREDKEFMVALARQCALALERARLYEAERMARGLAELATDRLAFLSEATEALASSLNYRRTLARLVRLIIPRLADWCVVYVVEDDGSLRDVALGHADIEREAELRELIRTYPPDPNAPFGVAAAIRNSKSELYPESHASQVKHLAVDERQGELVLTLGLSSSMHVPLVARGRTLGGISFACGDSGRHYGSADLSLAEELARRAAMAVDNARLFQERSHAARTLQRALLPPRLPDIPGLDLSARYRPAAEGTEVGGDFYDVFGLGGGRWGVAIGDVCGKGIDAAALTGLARHTVAAAAISEDVPSVVLGVLNDVILREGSDRFCTVAYGRLEPASGASGRRWRLTASSGGHPLPLVLRASGDVETVECQGTLLGVVPEPHLTDCVVELDPGDAVLFYTDGVIEARGGDTVYGPDRLLALWRDCKDLDSQACAEKIEAAVVDFEGDAPRDDLAVLVVRVTP